MGNLTIDNNKFKDDIYDIIEESEKTIKKNEKEK